MAGVFYPSPLTTRRLTVYMNTIDKTRQDKTMLNESSSGDEIPERDMTYHLLCLLIYHWTTTHLYLHNIFPSRPNDNCYISDGRRFTKSALRILLLSTFRVSSINYSLASSLPIHRRSSATAEGPRAHCQLKSCKMLHKCSTGCI